MLWCFLCGVCLLAKKFFSLRSKNFLGGGDVMSDISSDGGHSSFLSPFRLFVLLSPFACLFFSLSGQSSRLSSKR